MVVLSVVELVVPAHDNIVKTYTNTDPSFKFSYLDPNNDIVVDVFMRRHESKSLSIAAGGCLGSHKVINLNLLSFLLAPKESGPECWVFHGSKKGLH